MTTLQVPLTQPLTDAFQEAEYAAFGFLAQTQANFQMPVLIHGGLDVLPSRLAALACGADHQLMCVRGINTTIQLIAAGLFVTVLAVAVGLGTTSAVLASLPAAAMLWLYDGPTQRIVDAHQGTPGVRDVFVMAGLLLSAVVSRRLDRGNPESHFLLVLLGVLAGLGLFWAYNRGLVLGVVALLASGGVGLIRRSPLPILLVSIGGLAGTACVVLLGGARVIAATVFDISYWSQNGAIWQSSLNLLGAIPFFLFTLLVLTGALPLALRLRTARPGRALMLVVLTAVYVMYVVQTLNRPDAVHLRWSVWPAMLIAAILIRTTLEGTAPLVIGAGSARLAFFLLMCGVSVEAFSDPSIVRTVVVGIVGNLSAMTGTLPTDRALAGDDMAQAADQIAATGRCTFAANNAGILYLLARLPPCSRFAFGIYVAPDHQAEVIAALEAAAPAIIPWDSSAWYSRIDGRSFHDRTPILADWIDSHYPIETRYGGQLLRSRHPPLLKH